MPTEPIRMRLKDVEPLLDVVLLQPLELLPSEQHRSERVRETVCRSAKLSNELAPFPHIPSIEPSGQQQQQ